MSSLKYRVYKLGLAAFFSLLAASCDKSGNSYSLLGASQSFQQSSSTTTNQKIDILWVIDNSRSMSPFQTNLVTNFNSFIKNFVTNGYDFHLAVTTSEAYKATLAYKTAGGGADAFYYNVGFSGLRDGVFAFDGTTVSATHSGYPIIDKNTPNVNSTFVFNANQGDNGSGDERVFVSMMTALNDPTNASFRRPGAFLAIIILSDEDDFSDPGRVEGSWALPSNNPNFVPDHDYADLNLPTVNSFVSQLDTLTNSTDPSLRNYSVSAITVLDSVCLASHTLQEQQDPATGFTSTTIIGQRYITLANTTNGVLGDICSTSFAASLAQIQQKILELSTEFKLTRAPDPSSIQVMVNGAVVISDATNGWTYDSVNNGIVFHGTAIPPQGAVIAVNFNPLNPTN